MAPLVRPCLEIGMTLPPADRRSRVLVRREFLAPRTTFEFRGPGLSTLPRFPPFL